MLDNTHLPDESIFPSGPVQARLPNSAHGCGYVSGLEPHIYVWLKTGFGVGVGVCAKGRHP